jgi:hypothetical protein
MADDRIDIEINDAIDPKISTKLQAIAAGADKGENAVKRLKAALADINSSPASRLKAATDEVTSSLNRELNAQRSVSSARDATTSTLSKEVAQRERLSKMVDASIAQMEREAAARRAASIQSGPVAQAIGTPSQAAAQTAEMRSTTLQLAQARETDAAAARLQAAAQDTASASITKGGAAAGLARHHVANLGFQLQDIIVSLQAGQNPLTVFIQQGGQIGQIMGQAGIGVGGLAKALWGIVAPFTAVLAIAAAVFAALKLGADSLTQSGGLDAYAKSLGLTNKELKKLGDTSVTIGDEIQATFQVLSENILSQFGLTTKEISSFWADMGKNILYYSKAAFIGVGALVATTFQVLYAMGANVLKLIANTVLGVVNAAAIAIQTVINGAIDAINLLARGANVLASKAGFGEVFGQIQHVDSGVKSLTDGMLSLSHVDPMKAFNQNAQNSLNNLNKIGDRAIAIRKGKIDAKASEIIADRTPKHGRKGAEDHTAENRAQALRLVNLELDNELKRMQELKPEREVSQRMDQIEQQLAAKKITLSQTERAEIEKKVRAVRDYAEVQSQVDRIYEASTGPLRTYTATLAAANKLLADGKITQQDYAREVGNASRTYAEAIDPFMRLKEEMTKAENASTLYGKAVQQANYYDQIRQQLLSQYPNLSTTYVAGVNAEVDALMRRNDALQQQQFVQQQTASVVDPILQQQQLLDSKTAVYAEIDRLRQMDRLNEEQAQRAKLAFQIKADEQRLGAASDFFGALADVTKGGNGAIGAINKAAAIAQATIDGFVATQKALASAPPPWNFVAAAAVALKTGMTVAKIASTNVGSYQNGGAFVVDGKAGVDRNNINMNVSRGERVTIETPAQQRASDKNGGGASVSVNPKIVNLFDEKSFLGAIDSEDGEEVIMNVIARRKSDVKQMMGG